MGEDATRDAEYKRLAKIMTSRVIQIRPCSDGLATGWDDIVQGYQCDSKLTDYHKEPHEPAECQTDELPCFDGEDPLRPCGPKADPEE